MLCSNLDGIELGTYSIIPASLILMQGECLGFSRKYKTGSFLFGFFFFPPLWDECVVRRAAKRLIWGILCSVSMCAKAELWQPACPGFSAKDESREVFF